MSYLDFSIDSGSVYLTKLDESVNVWRQPQPSSTVSGGSDGEDYEVSAWTGFDLAAGLIYCFECHKANTGPCTLTHGTVIYEIKKYVDGAKIGLEAGDISEKWLVKLLYDGNDFVVLNPLTQPRLTYIPPTLIGSALSVPTIGAPTISAMTRNDIAFIDNTNGQLRWYNWNGSAWAQVGSGLTVIASTSASLTALNNTDIAYIDDDNEALRVYRWNGSAWSQIGSDYTTFNIVSVPNLAALNATDVALTGTATSGVNFELALYRWSGSSWSKIGTGVTLASGSWGTHGLAALNSTDVAVAYSTGGGNNRLRTYRWDGSTWTQIGNELAMATLSNMTALSNNTVVINGSQVGGILGLNVFRFDGTNWFPVSTQMQISGVGAVGVAALNGSDVAFIDASNEQLRYYRFGFYFGNGPQ